MSKITIAGCLLIALASAPPARAAARDTVADRVLGQRGFGTAIPYFVDGTALDAADIAIDRSTVPNRVYVASPDLNRVLGWSDLGRFRAGAPADLVLGQPSVFDGSSGSSFFGCPAPASATTFCAPDRVAVDPAGNLYVVDAYNFRVLEFDRPFATDRVADRVFGQASFTARKVPVPRPLNYPADLAVDARGNLWVVDPAGSRRILEYDAPVSRGTGPDPTPDRIIAAATEAACAIGAPARPCLPASLELSSQGDLYVLDLGVARSSRRLVYQLPLTTDLKADFTLAPEQTAGYLVPQPGVFDAAGNLVFLAYGQVWRYPAPIGPTTTAELLSPQLDIGFIGRPALDSQGNLYVASYETGHQDNFVYVVDPPFQAVAARVGSEYKTTRGLAAPAILAIDRSASPNHLYVVDAYSRILGWRDAEGFANGAAADLVLESNPGGACTAAADHFCPYGSLFTRGGLAVDSHGNLWMADVDNHRVLELHRPFESDAVADRVLGQGGSFTSNACNLGGVSARSLCFPGALAFDSKDHLYVADLENHRVLLFEHPETDDAATKVFGQPDFTHGSCNGRSGPGAATLCLGGLRRGLPAFLRLIQPGRGPAWEPLRGGQPEQQGADLSRSADLRRRGGRGHRPGQLPAGAPRHRSAALRVRRGGGGLSRRRPLRGRSQQRPRAGVPQPFGGHHGRPRFRARRFRHRRRSISAPPSAGHGRQSHGAVGDRGGRPGQSLHRGHRPRPGPGVRRALMKEASWILLIALSLAAPVHAAAGDTAADRVLGQRRLSTSIPYFVDGRIFAATDVAVDRSATPNRIYLADAELNRVLGWSDVARFRAGAAADLVLGQPSQFTGANVYTQKDCPTAPSATTFCRPIRVAVDFRGNVYVADLFDFRVLEFDSPFTTDKTADRVFGQPDFVSRKAAVDPAHSAIDYFMAVTTDDAGNVWMTDPTGTRRVLEFDDPLTNDTKADRAIEPGALGGCVPRDHLCQPADLDISPQGDLYVQDFRPAGVGGGQLFVYLRPLATDLKPDLVLAGNYGYNGLVFDPAGNLLTAGGFYVSRLAAPIGPGSSWQTVAGPFDEEVFTGRVDRDSAGTLYAAGTPWPESGNDRAYLYDPPYQTAPIAIGRERMTDRGLARPTLVAVDRSSSPNHLFVLDTTNRVLGWRDSEGFASGAPADLVIAGNDPALGTCNPNGVDARRFCAANSQTLGGLAVDPSGNLWLSDPGDHRVLEFDRPFESDAVADRVLGQGGSFTTRVCNQGGVSARSLCVPGALAFDRDGNLYVADLRNSRVLLFRDPLRTDAVADKVFGQADFQHGVCGAPSARTLCLGFEEGDIFPQFVGTAALAVDRQGTLYVADSVRNRVLLFRNAATSDAVADAVLGQSGKFTTQSLGTGRKRFGGAPEGLAVGPAGELYVADTANDRLLVFDDPLRRDSADRVFGHADFNTGGNPLSPYVAIPPPTAKNLLRPHAIAVDGMGDLYVADTEYNRVLAFDRP
jgi:DNA-binding beta-propeller fold protein YncE